MKKPIALRCTFRSQGYSEQEIKALSKDLAGVAILQPRRHGYPAAGADYDMTVVLQFVGSSIIGGLIWDGIKLISKSFYDFYVRKKKNTDGFSPQIDLFELRFDDCDLRLQGRDFSHGAEFNFLSGTVFEHLPELVAFIKEHLESEPLLSADKLAIDVFEPVIIFDDGDTPTFKFELPWRIEGEDITGPKSYSPHDRELSDDYAPPVENWRIRRR